MVTTEVFKRVMRCWASTVTIITTRHNDVVHGLTATAFSSLNANPPQVLVCIYKQARTHALVEQSGVFCVNFLSTAMLSVSDRFAGRHPAEDRFQGVRFRAEATGAPVLSDAIAYLDCRVARALDAGEHTVFIGDVVAADVQEGTQTPLLYFNGAYFALGEKL